jgi:hypothetical protein
VVEALKRRKFGYRYLPPSQGGPRCWLFLGLKPGLKPQAESYSPFGTKSSIQPKHLPHFRLHITITPRDRIRRRGPACRAVLSAIVSGTGDEGARTFGELSRVAWRRRENEALMRVFTYLSPKKRSALSVVVRAKSSRLTPRSLAIDSAVMRT